MGGRLTAALVASLSVLAATRVVRADTPDAAPQEAQESLDQRIAVWRFDGLGIDAEIVSRLEALFRVELGRLDKQPLPSRRDVEHALPSDLQACTGDDKCLAAIGKKVGVATVVAGTVATLGDSYVLDIKAIDVASGKLKRIQSDPLKGTADDLIEGVRVAAYRLLAPTQLHGAVQIQSDLIGAEVSLDDKPLGKSPLANRGVINNLELGTHKLHVAAPSYDPFDTDVDIHFQKVTRVDVHLLPSKVVIGTGAVVHEEPRHIYQRPWFVIAVGVVAISAAILIGEQIGSQPGCTVLNPMGGMMSGGCR
jgi:hypothetical protein